jgi:hypothetical protein
MNNLVPHLDKTATGEQVADVLSEIGCVIVDCLVSEQDMDRFTADMKQWFDSRQLGHDEFSGRKTRRVSALVARSAVAREIALNPTVIDVCDRLLLPNCDVYRLNVTHMVNIGPGEVRQTVHRDDEIYPEAFHEALPTLNKLVHCMWAVTEFTAASGLM